VGCSSLPAQASATSTIRKKAFYLSYPFSEAFNPKYQKINEFDDTTQLFLPYSPVVSKYVYPLAGLA
jgi:hypothetical protein